LAAGILVRPCYHNALNDHSPEEAVPVEIPDPPDAKRLARVGLTQAEYEELCR